MTSVESKKRFVGLAVNLGHDQHDGKMSECSSRIPPCLAALEAQTPRLWMKVDSNTYSQTDLTSLVTDVHPSSYLTHLQHLSNQLLSHSWNCGVCTFSNASNLNTCSLCGSAEPKLQYVIPENRTDLYLCANSLQAALGACESSIHLAQAVWNNNNSVSSGFALVRPPGHHATSEHAGSFCLLNNVVVTAQALLNQRDGPKRILILDWDVHHGDGTQNLIENDDSLLSKCMFISIHRYTGIVNGKEQFFWPGTGSIQETFNKHIVNLPLPGIGYRDSDYFHLFETVILPIAHQFAPELIIVSAGFDSAAGDAMGRFEVSPQGFEIMSRLLSSIRPGKVACVLEGGYNLAVLPPCVSATMVGLSKGPCELKEIEILYPEQQSWRERVRNETTEVANLALTWHHRDQNNEIETKSFEE